ncbi:50S ribosomal protein L11 methyltransferase [Rubellimicrobium sp. CFH 75288]|uniref:50S ribosomal protein L11 methyltransferase n=1 Tax=Rubellimicrobium sp. CFH 75288 TaxID=2697034 RepID=UPI0014131EF0|nr:50S ribosomal protein L11 methyltransferase [Rubellimicrobium sp. CFH 75288]NAZ36750.1 methyltransferase domain-containing protein [Rubellimicrobium sp. CFH 75288]
MMFSALTTLPGQAAAERLAAALEALGPFAIGHFEIEDGSGRFEVGAHFVDRPDEVALALLAAAHGARPFAVSEVPDVDWVAHVRRELPPVEAGRFFLYGSHDAHRVPEDRIALLIEASVAFGTGHHGTTLGCLRALDQFAEQSSAPRAIADVGTGTAVLAMAAARLWPEARIVASDIDPVAIETARANLQANGLEDRVETVTAAGFDHPSLAGPFDLVLANILKGPLIDLAPAVAAACAPGGHVILSGLLREQAPAVLAAYARMGINHLAAEEIGDWATLVLGRNGENGAFSGLAP